MNGRRRSCAPQSRSGDLDPTRDQRGPAAVKEPEGLAQVGSCLPGARRGSRRQARKTAEEASGTSVPSTPTERTARVTLEFGRGLLMVVPSGRNRAGADAWRRLCPDRPQQPERRATAWCGDHAWVSSPAALQGLLVTAGVAGVIVRVQPVFLAIKWAGVAYLAWLAFALLRSAARGDYADVGQVQRQQARTAYRQGFLCNATNPKILVFYLSLLPQFVARDAPWPVWLVYAWTAPFLGTFWCLSVVVFVGTVRTWLQRRTIRRALDAASGLVLVGFCARLAFES
jgi:threonine/homoserine/homoserine lactone efflux protein